MVEPSKKKHALLIGIDVYPHFPEENQLKSCVNDVELMARVLEQHCGFTPGDIRLLKNEEATRDGIRAAVEELIRRVGMNDIAVVHYSGHGSRKRNSDGYDADGYDETIVPYDSGRRFEGMSFPNRDITDEQFYHWLLELSGKTPHVTMIFDSCHSGTLTRASARIRRVPADDRPAEAAEVRSFRGEPRKRGRTRFGERHVLIAACREDETAKEYPEVGHGALTYFLCQELLRAESRETYRDLYERFAPRLTARFRTQRPQLEGAWDRLVFGIEDFEPMRYLTVDERTDDEVVIGGGAAHGLAAGSEWRVYPPGTRQVSAEVQACGHVRLHEVAAVSARAKILREQPPGSVVAGGRAVERLHDYGEMQWAVRVHGGRDRSASLRADLEQRIEASTLLRAATADEAAKARIDLGSPASCGLVEVIGESGELLMGRREAETVSPKELIDGIESWCRYHHTLELSNPNLEGRLRGKVELAFLRRDPQGVWQRIESTPNSEVVYEEGESLAFSVTNRHEEPIYVNVLDFGLTGSVSQLYPVAGAREALAPGRAVEVGTRPGDEMEVFLPEGFPFGCREEVGGREQVKVFATTRQADFRWLTQKGVRGNRHPLERLLRTTLHGPRRGESRRVPTDDWTTVIHSFFLRRRGL